MEGQPGPSSITIDNDNDDDNDNNNENNNGYNYTKVTNYSITQDPFIQERLLVIDNLTTHLRFFTEKAVNSDKELEKFKEDIRDVEFNTSDAEKLLSLYNKAIEGHEKESEAIRLAMVLVQEIRSYAKSFIKRTCYAHWNKRCVLRRREVIKTLYDAAVNLPLWIGKSIDDKPPVLCGAIAAPLDYKLKIGDVVAALIPIANDNSKASANTTQTPSKESDGDWILAEVAHCYDGNRYEIDDIDEEQKDRHILTRKSLIPLPQYRANPETNPEALFEPGARVLALYPQTTCFYRGKVLHPPFTATAMYHIMFVDAGYTEGFSPALEVPQRYVVPEPENVELEKTKTNDYESDTDTLDDLVPRRFIPAMSLAYKSIRNND